MFVACPSRASKNWTMQDSNDGSTWAVLDTQAGQAWTNNETLTFRVPVVSAVYRYYRLNITANNGDGAYTVRRQLLLRIDDNYFSLRVASRGYVTEPG
jgi:hypothetical protein